MCVRLAGVFNINVIEINSCYFASANTGQEGFVYAKDSNGNYPNNSLLYGNDSEQGGASVSFGVIGYDVQGAQDITISRTTAASTSTPACACRPTVAPWACT